MHSVLVLLSSFNGEKYIKDQIKSLIEQKEICVRILVRDDGSSDMTVKILKELKYKYSNIELIIGENIGYAKSFMTLVHMAKNQADYYAFCDQDDIWKSDKLNAAILSLKEEKEIPSLYLSSAKVVDNNLNPINVKFHKRKVSLGAVLEHNYAMGCTMVFNEALRTMLDIDISKMNLTCGHDSWVYLVALSIGAKVYFDLNEHMLYRQHGKNTSGKIISLRQAIKSASKLLIKWKGVRSDMARKIISSYQKKIKKEDLELLSDAVTYKDSIIKKIRFMSDKRMNSDYFIVDLMFKFSVLFNLF